MPIGLTCSCPGTPFGFLVLRWPFPRPLPTAAGLWSTDDGVSAFRSQSFSCRLYRTQIYTFNYPVLKDSNRLIEYIIQHQTHTIKNALQLTGLSGTGSRSSGGRDGGSR